jgi:hypothetical protein
LAPIHYAARAGYHSALHHLLEAGVDPVTHRKKDDVHDVYIDNGHAEPLIIQLCITLVGMVTRDVSQSG